MRLSDKLKGYQGQSASHQQQPFDVQTGLSVGSIRGAALSYTQQITARFEGQLVTLLGSADIVGMSQCEKFIPLGANQNTPDWAPSDEVEVIAINGVPVGQQGLTEYATPTQARRSRAQN